MKTADKARADEKGITFSSSRRRPSRSFCALASGDCERTTEKDGSGMAERERGSKKIGKAIHAAATKVSHNGEQPEISETEATRRGRLACAGIS